MTQSSEPPESGQEPQDLLAILGAAQPLFAILDASRDPQVLEVLREAHAEFESLYEGPEGKEMADYAPYLVRLSAQSDLLPRLLREGWGNSWGVFLTCPQPLREVRKHLRHFLLAQMPNGDEVFFRFFDPRVLRLFLPACNREEARRFFGPLLSYWMEDEEPGQLLKFSSRARGVDRESLAVFVPDPVSV